MKIFFLIGVNGESLPLELGVLFCDLKEDTRTFSKGKVSRDFRPLFFFLSKDSEPGPHLQRVIRFCDFFDFAKIFDYKGRKSHVHVVNNYTNSQF